MAKVPRTKVTADDMLDLTVSVEQLTEEIRLLRMAIDKLRDDVVWAARQVLATGETVAPGQMRRQYDPLASDAVEMPMDERTVTEPERRQGNLF